MAVACLDAPWRVWFAIARNYAAKTIVFCAPLRCMVGQGREQPAPQNRAAASGCPAAAIWLPSKTLTIAKKMWRPRHWLGVPNPASAIVF